MPGAKGKSGGPRPNSGPKRKAEKYESTRLIAERKIQGWVPEILEALHDVAVGHLVQDTDKEGNERTYVKSPDPKAGIYLLDRVLGKVPDVIVDETPPENRPALPNGTTGMFADIVEEVLRRRAEKVDKGQS